MTRYQELLQERAELSAEGAALLEAAEGRALSEEEASRDDKISARLTEVNREIARLDSMRERQRNAPAASVDGPAPEAQAVHRFEGAHPFGDMLLAAAQAELNPRAIDPRLRMGAAISGASEGSGADGGFLVNEDVSNDLIRETFETGILVQRVQRRPISSMSNRLRLKAIDETSRVDGSRRGGLQLYWQGEGDKATGSRPKFRDIELELRKLTGLYYATEELMQDAAALEADVRAWFLEEFGYVFDDVILNGVGGNQPRGILNGSALVSVAKEPGQNAKTIVAENVMKMFARMWSRSVGNAEWYINQDCWPQLFQLHLAVGTGGVPIFVPPGGFSAAPFGSLMGRPINPIEQAATLGTVGDIMFLDLGQYLWATKDGVQTNTSIHVRFLEGEMAFRFIVRVDGEPKWNSALTPAKGSDTVSPFVALATRA